MSPKKSDKESSLNQISLLEWDWDDTDLIAAFDIATKELRARNQNDSQANDENVTSSNIKQWKKNDYCQALYSGDNLHYEAQILEMHSDDETCSVIFLGYENQERVKISDLRKSKGKAARKQQIQNCLQNNEDNESLKSNKTNNDMSVDSGQSSGSPESKEDRKSDKNNSGHQDQQTFSTRRSRSREHNGNRNQCQCHHQNVFSFAPDTPCPAMSKPNFLGPNFMPPIPMHLHEGLGDQDMISSMLHSWYMAGYHTGLLASRMRSSNHHH